MPTVTIQCGQAGNQLGQELWGLLASQPQVREPAATRLQWEAGLSSSSEFFRADAHGRRQARCLLVDTEPKVVNSILASSGNSGIFSRQNCFTGHSGRGNNWAYGYSQIIPSRGSGMSSRMPRWNSSTAVEDPNTQEAHLLDHLQEGIRKECEAVDGAPDFLMLHSLGGGSGSGLGSRLLECLREEYPLNYVATVSVAPRPAGDSPMQSLNSTMALSFLQAYADVVMVFDNQAMLEAAMKSQKTANMADVNYHIALSVLGAIWPLSPGEPHSGHARIRDMATTVAADSCLKLVEARTSAVPAASGVKGLWKDASLAVARLFPRFDVLDANNPIVTSSALLLARGFPTEILQPSPPPKSLLPPQFKIPRAKSSSAANASDDYGIADHEIGLGARRPGGRGAATREVPLSAEASATAASTFVQACHGTTTSFACPPDAVNSIWPRHGPCKLSLAHANTAGEASKRKSAIAGIKNTANEGGTMAITAVANRSSAIGLLSRIGDKARLMSQTGAYLHWFERYGCSKAALDDALETVDNMADSYRLAHGIRDFL